MINASSFLSELIQADQRLGRVVRGLLFCHWQGSLGGDSLQARLAEVSAG
jgi:hypothetical protein